MCKAEHCALESCIKRHPTLCRYFSTFCKFGDHCCYKHVTPQSNKITDTTYLVAQFNSLEEQIKAMSNQINNLEKEINNLTKTTSSSIMFNGDKCG